MNPTQKSKILFFADQKDGGPKTIGELLSWLKKEFPGVSVDDIGFNLMPCVEFLDLPEKTKKRTVIRDSKNPR